MEMHNVLLAKEIPEYRLESMLNTFDHSIQRPIGWSLSQRCQHQPMDARNDNFYRHIRQSNVGNSHIWPHFRQLDATDVQMF